MNKVNGVIGLIVSLDTKGAEAKYIKELIRKREHNVIVIDVGCQGESYFVGDITNEEVAKAAGALLSEVKALPGAGEAMTIMTRGATKITKELYHSGRIDAVISIGGGMGSALAATAMKGLPVGVPKLLVSTKIAQGGAEYYVGNKDITLMPSIADVAGLNRVTKQILCNAVGAITGMVEAGTIEAEDKPIVVMSMLGTTTECNLRVKSALEAGGYEVIAFHSIGSGGKALEEFVATNVTAAVVEIALNEIGCYLFGGSGSAGPDRLTAAGKKGIPQVIACGGVELINLGGPEAIPAKYKHRKLYYHNPLASALRLNARELRVLGRVIAEKLNKAVGPVEVVIPTGGFSSLSRENGIFYDPEADRAFIKALKATLKKEIVTREVEANVNDDRFAEVAIETFESLMDRKFITANKGGAK